ncbi:synaptotagmin-1 [Onthophagus taurus]|uniref:synaptotagmin-1 n=1 Tax=Onthophagus taurus TaxID=166361 RepID=UPI000C20ABEB|nr:synaptotagmin-1 [Onthophagus taurus]XP_022914328.1 synaptotagmin-1 [Onthophagus taurus]
MDSLEDEEERDSVYIVALYAVVSFICVLVLIMVVYVACTKKYKLNWFEKNLLENADGSKEMTHCSQEALMGMNESTAGSSKILYPLPPERGKFWIPHNLQINSSCPSDIDSSPDNSLPTSPTSSTSLQPSPFSGPIAIARNDTQVILTNSSPLRPRVASMQSKLDHTKIDTSLYQKESPGEPEDVRGSIHLSLSYDLIAGLLTVRLIEAHDLQARDFSGTADPYAKIRLLPDKTNVWQTRIHKKTLNPVFDEDFVFEVKSTTLSRHTLEVLLYDFDAYSRHHNIGGVQLPLCNIDLNEKVNIWQCLTPCFGHDPKVDLGELMVSLAYLPSAERLTVVVIKARNLRIVDDTRNSSDPYVKVSLYQGIKRLKKRKTGVHRNTINPVFNEALTFDIDKESLKKCRIEFNVLHDSLLGASEMLGYCRVGRTKECRPEEKSFFIDMLKSKTATAQWLTLADDPKMPP